MVAFTRMLSGMRKLCWRNTMQMAVFVEPLKEDADADAVLREKLEFG